MKKIALGILPLALLGSLFFAGCASRQTEPVYVYSGLPVTTPDRAVVVLQEPPPSPHIEIETTAPGPVQVWIKGFWDNSHGKWVWLPGHWESRPHEGAVWVSGHWDKDPENNGWTWTPGHWA